MSLVDFSCLAVNHATVKHLFLVLILTVFIIIPLTFLPSFLRKHGDLYNFSSYREKVDQPRAYQFISGESLPGDFELLDINGKPVALKELWQDRPLVIETGSQTCPVYIRGSANLEAIAERFGEKARFILFAVREAHPGFFTGPHRTLEQKLGRAVGISHHMKRAVYTEALDGKLHYLLGGGPNAAFIVGRDGVVTFSSFWAVGSQVETALSELLAVGGEGKKLTHFFTNPCRIPKHISNGEMMKIMARMVYKSGPDALYDFYWNSLRSQTEGGSECR